MKRLLFLFFALFALSASASTTQQKRLALYGVAFYNLENLFDTIHAPGKNDYDFLPEGSYAWDGLKYQSKLKNLSSVLAMLCTDRIKAGAAVIGVSEVENRQVLEDLIVQPELAGRGLRIIHHDTDDRRGVDCAFLYNPRFFTLERELYVPYIYPTADAPQENLGFRMVDHHVEPLPLYGDTTHITRGFLCAIGRMAEEPVCLIVNHWPSRGAESPARERAAMQVRCLVDALATEYGENMKFIVMGDLNDDPDNISLTKGIGCKFKASELKGNTDFFNPWYYTLRKQGQGTLLYNNRWNLFDQILISGNAVDPAYNLKSPQKVAELDLSKGLTFYQHAIFIRDFLFQQEGRYKGSPLRTHAGGTWLNGYSDHLPTQIYLVKQY